MVLLTVAQTSLPAQGESARNILINSSQAEYRWSNVAIGGGGYVTGLVIHPKEPGLVYIRTDIGGFYRWDEEDTQWIPISDHFDHTERDFYFGESIALDPNDPDVVYIAAGANFREGTIFKSTDRGKIWYRSNLTTPMHGNGDLRWAGERLAVNPFDSKEILFGSRTEGLFKSIDAGLSWEPIGIVDVPADGIGILGVLFDSTSEGRVYANVYGEGIYESVDGGDTWYLLEGSPDGVLQMSIDDRGTLYTAGRKVPKVAKKEKSGEEWKDITPLKFRLDRSAPTSTQMVLESFNFNGISVDPNNHNHIVLGIDYKMPGKMFRSTDGGDSWVEIEVKQDKTVPWWQDDYWGGSMAALVMDPHVSGRVWFTDWFGIWRTENISGDVSTWTILGKGIEQIVATTLLAPPAAPTSSGYMLMSGAMDICGLVHYDLGSFPEAKMHPVHQDTWTMDYSASQPWHVVRVGENRAMNFLGDYVVSTETYTYGGAVSADEGKSWQNFKIQPPVTDRPTNVAMSATNPHIILLLTGSSAFRTQDGGASWQSIDSLHHGGRRNTLAADRVNGQTFYHLHNGTVYRSINGGITFTAIPAELPDGNGTLKTVYGMEGEVWASFGLSGLYRSSDGGSSFAKIEAIDQAVLFDLGKPLQNGLSPVLYVYGTVSGRDGVFRSFDFGESWDDISPTDPVGIGAGARVMTASQQHSGLVFIGTGGRGIFYGIPDNFNELW